MSEPAPAEPGLDDELPIDPDVESGREARHHPHAEGGPFGGARARRWPRLSPRVLAAVFVGGVAGGLARYAVTTGWPTPAGRYPWATFTINAAGVFALALLIVVWAELIRPSRYARPLLGTGFLGAFTTFSSVVTSTDQLAAHGHPRTAVLYLAGSLLAGLGAASFGLLLGRAIAAARQRDNHTQTPTT